MEWGLLQVRRGISVMEITLWAGGTAVSCTAEICRSLPAPGDTLLVLLHANEDVERLSQNKTDGGTATQVPDTGWVAGRHMR